MNAIIILGFAGLLLWALVREVLFLRPNSAYWIDITKDWILTSSPVLTRQYEWHELAPFTFEVESVDGIETGFIYIDLKGEKSKIHADDFASRLASDKENATRRFCEFLNLIREMSLNKGFDEPKAEVDVPGGLRIAPEGLRAHAAHRRALAAWRSHEPVRQPAQTSQKDRAREGH